MTNDWRKRYAPGTVYTRTYPLRKLLAHLAQHGAPTIKPQRCAVPPPRAVILKPGELEKLLAAAPLHLRLFIQLCAQLALRFMEAYELTPGDHDPEQHSIRVRVKGGKTRTLPTTPEIETLLAAARQGDATGRAIETLYGRSLQPVSLRGQFHRLVKETGITPALNPHDLRRSTATLLYTLTKDFRAVQQLLGHSQMTSTLHYIAPLAKEDLSQMLNALRRPPARA